MKIKAQMRDDSTHPDRLTLKKLSVFSFVEGQRELLFTAGEDINWYNLSGE